MKHFSRLSLACALLSLLCAGSSFAQSGQQPAPQPFAPVNGAHYLRQSKVQSSSEVDGKPVSLSAIEISIAERWERKGEGWVLHCEPKAISVQDSGGALAQQLQQLLLESPYAVVYNANGQVSEVLGFDTIEQKLRKELPEDDQQTAALILNAESQRWRIANNWDTQYAWLYGKVWQSGQQHSETATLQPPQGPALDFSQHSTIDAADATVLIITFENTSRVTELPEPVSLLITEKGALTLDVATGLPRQLDKSRLLQLRVPGADGQPITQKRTETTAISWTAIKQTGNTAPAAE